VNIQIDIENTWKCIIFPEFNNRMYDIDILFGQANRKYCELLHDLGLDPDFNFSKRNNKKLYTHEFIKNFVEFLKTCDQRHTLSFYSNPTNKDKFRNQLINKLKNTFNILVWEYDMDLKDFYYELNLKGANLTSRLELFFEKKTNPSFKKIKKNLEKEGLTNLNEVYFKNIYNKMCLFKH